MEKTKRGRKPQADARRKLVIMRLQQEEFIAIQGYAKTQGKPISTFIRDVTLQYLELMNVPTNTIIN
jgi:predicted DNA binding CopG/RHH family protein